MKKLLLPLLAVALLAGCDKKAEEPAKPAAAVSYLDKIKARDKLIVGVFTDKPPFGFVDEAGRLRRLRYRHWPSIRQRPVGR